ncbi:MAG: hypothetical protein ABWZ26_07645 [Candidatus Nanopelagicales bacterium]
MSVGSFGGSVGSTCVGGGTLLSGGSVVDWGSLVDGGSLVEDPGWVLDGKPDVGPRDGLFGIVGDTPGSLLKASPFPAVQPLRPTASANRTVSASSVSIRRG